MTIKHNHSAEYFNLTPFTFLVEGASNSALYDIHRGRIYPIPDSAAFILNQCQDKQSIPDILAALECDEHREVAAEYMEQLKELDFGEYYSSLDNYTKIHEDLPFLNQFCLRYFSVTLPEKQSLFTTEQLFSILKYAKSHAGCQQIHLFVEHTLNLSEIELLLEIIQLNFHHTEIILNEKSVQDFPIDRFDNKSVRFAISNSVPNANQTVERLIAKGFMTRISKSEAAKLITERELVANHTAYRLLKNSSVLRGYLHIDQDGDIYPHYFEKHLKISRVNNLDEFKTFLQSPLLEDVWSLSKDKIDKCKDCEFKYACPNPNFLRADNNDRNSAPTNCLYDPYTGTWDYGCEDIFNEQNSSSITTRNTKYFNVHYLNDYDFDSQYLALLDEVVEHVTRALDLPLPSQRFDYFLYPDQDSLSKGLLSVGNHVSAGQTDIEHQTDGVNISIKSCHPCHTHEILHALLYQLNEEPKFFVSEACATIFGRCWATEEHLASAQSLKQHSLESEPTIRVVNHNDQLDAAIDLNDLLIFDNRGLIVGLQPKNDSVHHIANHLVHDCETNTSIAYYYSHNNEDSMPGYLYDVGGSFFRYLLEEYGAKSWTSFYKTEQTIRNIETTYLKTLSELESDWKAHLKQF